MSKKISCFLVLTLIFIFMSSSVVLANDTDVISIQEYEQAIKAEFEKYDIDYEITDYDPNVTLTRDMLNIDLAKAKEIAGGFRNIQVIDACERSEIITPYMMPITKTYRKDFLINPAPIFRATIRVDVNLTYDGSNMEIISVNSKRAYQNGYALNFVSWTTRSIVVNTSNNYFGVDVTGAIKFQYTDPQTGITQTYTENNLNLQWGQRL